ncbi:aminotransferase class V-fold PLP-dependent enzyme [Streptomyces sp. NPDC002143]
MTTQQTVPDSVDAFPRREFTPAAEAVTYLNTGTAGPLLTPVAETMRRLAAEEYSTGRYVGGMKYLEEFYGELISLRTALAAYLGAGDDEIALTHHTTEGMNIVTWGLDLRAGDRVVTTTLEHGGALVPLYQLRKRVGVDLAFADIGAGRPDETLAALATALEQPAKLVVISHVTYGTGAVLPLREIADLVHERGALLLVDGAQSVGAIPLDLDASGADFYAFPGQKWLCGPEGTGGLFVRREHLDLLQATQSGLYGVDYFTYRANDPESLGPAPAATRYEVGSVYRPALTGLLAGVNWHLERRAQGELFRNIHQLTDYALARVAELPDTQVITPSEAHAGLVCFTPQGIDPAECVTQLGTQGIVIRSVPENGSLRLSCGFYNTPEEIDMTLTQIEAFRASSR